MGIVARLFESTDRVCRAVEDLKAAGFRPEDISVVMRDQAEAVQVGTSVGAGEAVATGIAGGGILGGLAGLLAGLGALAIPGIGPIIAAGPLVATLGGGALGAATGGMIGALAEQGISQEQARDFQEGVARGEILLTVLAPDGRETEAQEILDLDGGR